jgi:hypothetical protein
MTPTPHKFLLGNEQFFLFGFTMNLALGNVLPGR